MAVDLTSGSEKGDRFMFIFPKTDAQKTRLRKKKKVLLSAEGICENARPFSLKLPRYAEMKFLKKL